MSEKITSIKDVRVQAARALKTARGRAQSGKIMLYERQSLAWAMNAGLRIQHLFHTPEVNPADLAMPEKIPALVVSAGIMKKITGTNYVIPLVAVTDMPAVPGEISCQLALILDHVVDQGNIGTLIRTANGFGIQDVVLAETDFDPFYRKTVDASRGLVFQTRFHRHTSISAAADSLHRAGFQIVATSPHAHELQSTAPLQQKPMALIVGNESDGICDEWMAQADVIVRIPMHPAVESLNVGVAAGISMYEMKFKWVMTMLVNQIQGTLGRELNVAWKMVRTKLDRELSQINGMDSTRAILLMILKCDQLMTVEQAGRDSGLHGAELESLLQDLRGHGWIEDVAGDTPAAICLTASGEALLAQIWGVVEAAEEKVLADFSPTEREQLFDFLRRIQRSGEI